MNAYLTDQKKDLSNFFNLNFINLKYLIYGNTDFTTSDI